MTSIGIFLATFVTVFCLGFQSLNVNRGHYFSAMITSLAIGSSHIVLYKYLPDGSLADCLAYLMAGPLAITSSMWAHDRWMNKKSVERAGG